MTHPNEQMGQSLRDELLAKVQLQREVILDLCERVERLEMRADGLTPMERVERRWAKEATGKDSFRVGANGPKPFKGGVLVPAEILQPSPPRPGPFGWLLDAILGHRLPCYVPNPHPNAGKIVTTNEDGEVIVIPLPKAEGRGSHDND